MQVLAKQEDSVNASVSVSISNTSIQDEVQKIATKAAKTMKMDGFRVGKVPVSAVIKRYGKELEYDAEQNLFKEAINEALKELKKESKDMIAEPFVEKLDRNDKELKADLVISFKPEVKLDDYEKLIPEYSSPKVTKKELDARKEEGLKSFAKTEPIKEQRALKEGDFAKFDFEGFIDGKAFDGGKAENFTLEIGSKQFIPGFEEAMIGLKVGEEKDISVPFPKDYGVPSLAGKEAVFKIKLHEILELVLPKLDEELLKKLLPGEENPSEEMLEERLKEQIKKEKLYKLINEELRVKFADTLIEHYDFDLPRGVVEQETDIQFRTALSTFSEDELKEIRENTQKAKEKRDSFKDEARKSVKLTFIVDELAKLRKVSVSDQEVIQAVYFEAYRYGSDPKLMLEDYRKQGILPAIKMSLLEEKLFNDIFMPKEEKKSSKKEDK
ncbi:trigger factor [Campylobacter sp. MIT 99-7217]|uniref:trigger factor n=1 Tax=Campylobacter sp. MIT 99-7217 TaxID=535091 RepID=UPI001159B882|nr:trigger factor [Campylobacter sp. MIT 99-7217]TQR31332.1 trigger factor [Campylobacter sp. MIT 99-7217]